MNRHIGQHEEFMGWKDPEVLVYKNDEFVAVKDLGVETRISAAPGFIRADITFSFIPLINFLTITTLCL